MFKRIIVLTMAFVISVSVIVNASPAKVYLFGGQSNMGGATTKSQLDSEYSKPLTSVYFWNFDSLRGVGSSKFEHLDPQKTWFYHEGDYASSKFGPELSFAKCLDSISNGEDFYIIKFARNGMGLDSSIGGNFWPEASWEPWSFYFWWKHRWEQALASLDRQGIKYEIAGIVWLQGERDAKYAGPASRYAKNLAMLSDSIHSNLHLDKRVPFVFGQVLPLPNTSYAPYQYELRASMAKADHASGDSQSIKNVYMVSTDSIKNYMHDDKIHFNNEGILKLGKMFFNMMTKAEKEMGSVSIVNKSYNKICTRNSLLIGESNRQIFDIRGRLINSISNNNSLQIIAIHGVNNKISIRSNVMTIK